MFIKDPSTATIEETLKHNEHVRAMKKLALQEYENKLREIPEAIAPCMTCPYDGIYRCEHCEDSDFAGYNIADYP